MALRGGSVALVALLRLRRRRGGRGRQPLHIVDHVRQADLHPGAGDADGADEEVHLILLHGEHVFDAGAHLGLERVGASLRLRHRAARRLLAVDAANEAVLLQELLIGFRAIGCVGPDRTGRVGLVEQALAQPRAFISCGVSGVPAPDQPVLAVDRDVVRKRCFAATFSRAA
jgi:hypothetical protein